MSNKKPTFPPDPPPSNVWFITQPQEPVREKHKVITERAAATGIVICQVCFKDGRQDRADGPALIYCDPATHNVTYEAWFRQGQLSRIDGPALIRRDPATGTITREAWWKNGRKIQARYPSTTRHH